MSEPLADNMERPAGYKLVPGRMASDEKRDAARQDLKELMEKMVIAAGVTDGSQTIATLAEPLTATQE